MLGRKRDAHDIRQAARIHLVHDVRAMNFYCTGRDSEFVRGHLVGSSLNQFFKNVAFARRSSATAFISKPIEPDMLTGLIQKILSEREA